MLRGSRRLLARAALAAAGALSGAALVDGALFALEGPPPQQRYAAGWARDDLESRYVPVPGRFHAFGGDFRIDSLGLRGPETSSADVLFLGDSVTFGVGVPEKQTFVSLVGERGWSAANAGVPGYNTACALARLQEADLLALRPKLVVLDFGWNDSLRAAATESFFARVRRWARVSRLAGLVLRLEPSLYRRNGGWRQLRWIAQVPLADFKANLTRMIELAGAAGAKALVITPASDSGRIDSRWPFAADYALNHERYCEAAREASERAGAPVLDFSAQVARLPEARRRPLFLDAAHLSPAGHRLLARELAARISGLLGSPRREASQ